MNDGQAHRSLSPKLRRACGITWLFVVACYANAAIVEHDTLEVGLAPPDDALTTRDDGFVVVASDQLLYDDNIYRLAPSVTDLKSLPGIGPDPHRDDYIDTASLGANGQFTAGRQVLVADVRADYNRYDLNSNLNNVSSADRLVWNWNTGGLVTGQVGANYSRNLAGFVNAAVFSRNIYEGENYYATGRYQLGPRWAVYAGALESTTSLSEVEFKANDAHSKTVDFGTEYAVGAADIVGWEYRYTDARFGFGEGSNGDYREDNARLYSRYEISEKTSLAGSVGYLKRNYASSSIDSFSGYTWRIAARWRPTEKILVEADGWRNLQAYVTAVSDYFVSVGTSLSAQWIPTAKITAGLNLSYQDQKYIGTGLSTPVLAPRHDTLSAVGANLDYMPFNFLVFDFAASHELRSSNQTEFKYHDNLLRAKFTFKF